MQVDEIVKHAVQGSGDLAEAEARLLLAEERRKASKFVCYWEPCGDQLKFWEQLKPTQKVWLLLGGNGCLAEGTQVATPTGPRPIEAISPGDSVYAANGDLATVLYRYNNGEKEIWRWHGRRFRHTVSFDATRDHKVIIASQKDNTPRLQPLDNLGRRNYFVLADGMSFGERHNPWALALGLLLGDGYLAGAGAIQWTCAEPDLVDECRGYFDSLGVDIRSWGIQHRLKSRARPTIQRDSLNGRILGTETHDPMRQELQRLGLLGTKSRTKFIPKEVWSWCKEDVAQLLAGMIATDGSVYTDGQGWSCSYTSNNMDLMDGFVDLLAQGFGIRGSSICKGSKGTWGIAYSSNQAMTRLAQLPIPGRKGRLLRQITLQVKQYNNTYIHAEDRECLGHQPTYDLLIDHPSHVFQLQNGVQVSNSGKTQAGKFLTTAWLLGKDYFRDELNWKWVEPLPIPDGPTNVRGVALITDSLRDPMWEGLTGTAEHPPFFPPDTLTDTSNHLFIAKFKRGSKFHGKSAETDPKTHGGPNLDLVWLDEEASEPIFAENYQRTRKGGKLLVTATPLDDVGTTQNPWIYDLIEQWRAGDPDIGVVFMSTLNNPYLPDYEKRRQVAKWRGHPEEQARLYGIPVRRSGLYYPMWKAEPPLWRPAYDLHKDVMRVVMVDPATTGPVGVIWAAFDARGKMTIYRVYKEKGPTVSSHVEAIIAETRGEPINLWLMDPFMGRQTVAHVGDEHKKVVQVWREAGLSRLRLADVDYQKALEKSREYMQAAWDPTAPHPPLEVFDHCTQFKDEIERYIVDSIRQGPDKGRSKDVPRKGNSDLMECYQYLAGMNFRYRGGMGVLPQVDPAYSSSF